MIDTIGLKIEVSEQAIEQIKKSVFHRFRQETFNHGEFEIVFDIFKTDFAPSWDRKIAIRLDDINNVIDLSRGFSLPKVVYGHNCFMIYDYRAALSFFKERFESHYEVTLPSIDAWLIQRVDVCYNFKLASEEDVRKAIDYLRSFEYPRKKPITYKTSVYYPSSAYTFKIYTKFDEFKKYDFKHFKKTNRLEEGLKILNFARRLLRLEIEMRGQALKYHFKKDEIRVSDLSADFFIERLNFYLGKFLVMGGKNMNDSEIYQKLINFYTARKATRLYEFWNILTKNAATAKRIHPKSTFYRKRSDLKAAGVSLISIETDYRLNLTIPTDDCSNSADLWDKSERLVTLGKEDS